MSLSLLAAFVIGMPITADIHFPQKLDSEGFLAGIWDVGVCRISGQPSPEAFRKLAADGVKTVICLRGTSEMNDRTIVTFDEAELLKELGIDYVHIPVGEPEEYNFSAVQKFKTALDKGKDSGKVLLHCTVAWRASYVWTAYLYKFKNYDLTEAIRHGLAMNASANRVESLLGIKMRYEVTPKKTGAHKFKPVSAPPELGKKLHAPNPVAPTNEREYMQWTVWDMGDVLNSSQPNEQQLRDVVTSNGITTVINIRTPEEMAAVKQNGFDEEAVAKSLGLAYVSIPLQTSASFTPANLDLVAKAIRASKGKVLLHCQTGTRTSSVWAAYLTKFVGVELNEAMSHAEAMRYSNPLEDFLEMDLVYNVKSTTTPISCGGG